MESLNNEINNCCICYNLADEKIIFSCNHYICLSCFFKMININNNNILCPLCKNPLKTKINLNEDKINEFNNISVAIKKDITEIYYDHIINDVFISSKDTLELKNYYLNDTNYKMIKKYINDISLKLEKDIIFNGKMKYEGLYINDIYEEGEKIYNFFINKTNKILTVVFKIINNEMSLIFNIINNYKFNSVFGPIINNEVINNEVINNEVINN